MLDQILFSYVSNNCGEMIAEQFQDSFSNNDFEKQNIGALKSIKECLNALLDLDSVFSGEALFQIENYYEKLEEHIAQN